MIAASVAASVATIASLVAAAAGGSSAASTGSVAVFLGTAADDAVQRDIAAAVVDNARAAWTVEPDLLASAMCSNGEPACVRKLAQSAGAGYALIVKVAPLGARDHLVAVQLFDVTVEKPLFEESAVQNNLDARPVKALAAHLVALARNPPPPRAAPPATAKAGAGPGAWTWVGTGLVGAGVVAGVGTGVTAALYGSSHQPEEAGVVGVVGAITTGALLTAGSLAFLLDKP